MDKRTPSATGLVLMYAEPTRAHLGFISLGTWHGLRTAFIHVRLRTPGSEFKMGVGGWEGWGLRQEKSYACVQYQTPGA